MPTKKSTRRSISYKAEVFERARRYCAAEGIPLARWAEIVMTSALDARCVATIDREFAVASVQAPSRSREAELEELRRRAFG